MRVLLVSHRYPPDEVAGVERYTQTLASELVRRGDDVSIVTRRPASEPVVARIDREAASDGSTVYRFVGGAVDRSRFLTDHEQYERLFEQVVIETAPDVVHINHVLDLSPRLIEVARRHQAGVVLTLHDFYFACHQVILRKPWGELCDGPDGGRECAATCFASEGPGATFRWGLRTSYFRRLLSLPDVVVCPSAYVGAYFERFGVESDRLRVVPNGTWTQPSDPLAELSQTPKERGALRIAFLGSVVPHKGLHVILDALPGAEVPAVDLTVFGSIGAPGYVDDLRKQAAEIAGLTLRFYGPYEPSELELLLQDVDCVIVPSQWPETFSLVTREALIRGIPAIVTGLGAPSEAVTHGENGFVFRHDRPEELALILRRLFEDEKLVRRVRQGARATPILTASRHTEIIRGLYREAIDRVVQGDPPSAGDREELAFLHASLLASGFGAKESPLAAGAR